MVFRPMRYYTCRKSCSPLSRPGYDYYHTNCCIKMLFAIFLAPIDILMAPLALMIIYFVVSAFRPTSRRGIKNSDCWSWGLMLKLGGAISISLMYEYYFPGGDTTFYHRGGVAVYQSLFVSPMDWFELVFTPISLDEDPMLFYNYQSKIVFLGDSASYFVCRILGVTNIVTFGSYLANALLLATFSFFGSWVMYLSFARLYPHYSKYIFLAIFCAPSVLVWGSGIFKDTFTFAAMGFLIWSLVNIFFLRRRILISVLVLIFSFLLIYLVKVYIIMCLAPALLIWVVTTYNSKIPSLFLRAALTPIALIFAAVGGYYALNLISQGTARYNMDTLAYTAESTARWIHYVSETQGGSAYYLGDYDFTPQGMLRKFLPAVNVTFFRPYLWEVKNVAMLLSALESFGFLIFTIFVIRKKGVGKFFSGITSNPTVLFCLVFSIFFAFSVGVTTYNFGSLVRYKIPALPFYLIALILIWNPITKRVRVKRRVKVSRLVGRDKSGTTGSRINLPISLHN